MTLARLGRLGSAVGRILALCPGAAQPQQRVTLSSIASGGIGSGYYPLAGAMAGVLSRQTPGWQATAEVTGGGIGNLKLVGAGRLAEKGIQAR